MRTFTDIVWLLNGSARGRRLVAEYIEEILTVSPRAQMSVVKIPKSSRYCDHQQSRGRFDIYWSVTLICRRPASHACAANAHWNGIQTRQRDDRWVTQRDDRPQRLYFSMKTVFVIHQSALHKYINPIIGNLRICTH